MLIDLARIGVSKKARQEAEERTAGSFLERDQSSIR